jgi:uncharacterized protein YlxW (UPF0749 family)
VRIVASTYVIDSDGGVTVDGRLLRAPFRITVVGDAKTMQTALGIPGGPVEVARKDGGNVIVQEPGPVEVTALRDQPDLEYAKPVP